MIERPRAWPSRSRDLSERLGEAWRIAPEGEPPTAKRCACPEPLPIADLDGVECLLCGREPAIRLKAAEEVT